MSTPSKTVGNMHRNQDAMRKGDVDAGQPTLTIFILVLGYNPVSSSAAPPRWSPSPLTFFEVHLENGYTIVFIIVGHEIGIKPSFGWPSFQE